MPIAADALAAFMALGGAGNLAGPRALRAAYARWGYPAGFHRVTGAFELAAAALVAFPATRGAGIALAGVILLAAVATVCRHRDWAHLPPGLVGVVLVLACAVSR